MNSISSHVPFQQQCDRTSSAQTTEIRIDNIDPEKQDEFFDYTAHFGSADLIKRAQALEIEGKILSKRTCQAWWKFWNKIYDFRNECYAQEGEKAGKKAFRFWSLEHCDNGWYKVRLVMKLFDWLYSLPLKFQRKIRKITQKWAFDALKRLPNVPIALDRFFGLVKLHLTEQGKKKFPTASAVQGLIDALLGKRIIYTNTPMTLLDWVGFVNVERYPVESIEILDGLELARDKALEIARLDGREEVILSDAIAAFDSLNLVIQLDTIQPKLTKKETLEEEVQRRIQQFKEEKDQDYRQLETQFSLEVQRRQEAEERAIAAQDEIQQLKKQLEELSKNSETVDVTIDVTPVVETTTTETTESTTESDADKKATATSHKFNIRDNVRVIDTENYKDYFGCTGTVVGRSENGLLWVQLPQHGYRKQFPADALELLAPHESSEEAVVYVPIDEQVFQKFQEIKRTIFEQNAVPVAG